MSGELRVGWAGIGKMGAPMSRRVLEQGFALSVFEPVADNRAAIVAAGASLAGSPEQLADSADIVVATIPNDAALRSLVLGPAGLAEALRPGQIFVEMSTVSPDISAEVNSALAAKGIAYLRAPVSGSTATAAAGKLSVMVSGPEAAFRTVEPVMASFSARRFYLGAGEEARYLKLVLNALVGATSALLGEALTLGLRGNLSLEDMLSVICESAVASPLIAYKRDMLVSGEYAPAFSVAQMMKDFDLILQTAKQDHVPMFHAALIRQQYEAAYADGLADKDFFVLFERYRRLAGLMPTEPRDCPGTDAA